MPGTQSDRPTSISNTGADGFRPCSHCQKIMSDYTLFCKMPKNLQRLNMVEMGDVSLSILFIQQHTPNLPATNQSFANR